MRRVCSRLSFHFHLKEFDHVLPPPPARTNERKLRNLDPPCTMQAAAANKTPTAKTPVNMPNMIRLFG